MAGNEIEGILVSLNLPTQPLLPKALEMERMIRLKVPNGTLKKGEVCRPIIAIDIACRLLQISILKETLISRAAVPKKLYQDSYNTCKRLLHLTFPTNLTIDSLSLKYGNERIAKYAKSLLFTYLQATGNSNSLPLELLRAVAFFVTAKHHQLNIKQQKFIDDHDLAAGDFEPLVKDFETRMKDHLVHFHYEEESDLSLHSESALSGFLPLQTVAEGNSLRRTISPSEPPSSPSTISSLKISTDHSIIPNVDALTNKYKSNNSKRVADSILGQHKGNISGASDHEREEKELARKRQFTEKVFQMWLAEVKAQILFSNRP